METAISCTQTLRLERGDLLVFTTPHLLSVAQRDLLSEKLKSHVEQLGCQAIILDGSMSVLLIKKIAPDASSKFEVAENS